MSTLRCQDWTSLGIPCPGLFLEEMARKRKKERAADPEDPPLVKRREEAQAFAFDRLKRSQKTQSEQMATMAIMLELQRRMTADAFEKQRFRVPQEITVEAVRQGYRGIDLALVVAAVALLLATALSFGGSVVRGLPGVIKSLGGGPGGAPAGTGGFGGLHFEAPRFEGVRKRIELGGAGSGGGFHGSGVGFGFLGTEG